MKLRAGVLGLVFLAVSLALVTSGSTLAQAETRIRASTFSAAVGVSDFSPSAAFSQLGNGQSYDATASGPVLAAEEGGEAATALTKWDPDFAAKQLLGGNNVTAGGRTITYHAADRIVNAGRGIGMTDIDSILNNGVRVTYNALARGGPTVRVFDALGRSVVVDAETGLRVVTVIP